MSANLPTSTDDLKGESSDNGGDDSDQASTVSSLVRESADGGPTPSHTQNVNDNDDRGGTEDGKPFEGNPSEKEKENANEDLDKDIDVMIEVNTDNGFINPDASNSISGIQIDLTGDSVLDIAGEPEGPNEEMDDADVNGNNIDRQAEKGSLENIADTHPEVSEKSFASSTDSSVVAEAVVKKVIQKAVTEVNSNQNADTNGDAQQINIVKSDVKVGLFQYGGLDDNANVYDSDTEEEEEDEVAVIKETVNDTSKPKELKVGLFQYSEITEDEEVKSPEVIEMEDNDDDENKEDILKLYGLEGLDPVSPKSASPPESGPPSVENSSASNVLDVQRDVYEPQTRLFSVTRSSSSTDSTPRNVETRQEETNDINSDVGIVMSIEQPENHADIENGNFDTPTGSVEGDDKDDLKLNDFDNDRTGSEVPQDISPPLIQYEPVTNNGKFRIVKTVKEGGPNSYSGIRIGTSPSQSPRETESQESQSPRDIGPQDGQGTTGSVTEKGLSPIQSTRNTDEEAIENVPADRKTNTDSSGFLGKELSNTEAAQIDKDLIRELIQREKTSEMVPTRDAGISSQTHLDLSSLESAVSAIRPHDYVTGARSPQQMSLSDLKESPRENEAPPAKDMKHSPREETLGGEVELDVKAVQSNSLANGNDSQGRQSYNERSGDSRSFERRYQTMLEHDSYYSRSYDRDRDTSEEPSRDISETSNRYPAASYRDTQYERPAQRSVEPASHQPIRPVESGVIPGFKTLQQQQAKWTDMFKQLESEHKHELRSQYDKHQSNIKRLQQQMEHELQKQHLAIRKKLDIHKEALAKMSPEREKFLQERRYRSPDRSMSPGGRERSQDRTDERSGDVSELQYSHNSKTWREIYREVRAEESDQDPEPSPRLQRALDSEFASIDTTVERSRSTVSRPSPRGRSKERDVSNGESSRSFSDRFPSSYEEKMSRSLDRESKAKVKYDRSGSPVTNTENTRLASSTGSSRLRQDDVSPLAGSSRLHQDDVSPHVQELLDNLKDSHRNLYGLQEDIVTRPTSATGSKPDRTLEVSAERPRAGVYSSPMPVFKGKDSKLLSSEKVTSSSEYILSSTGTSKEIPGCMDKCSNCHGIHAVDKHNEEPSASVSAARSPRRSTEPQYRTEIAPERRKTSDHRDIAEREYSRDSFSIEDILSSSERVNLREKHSKHLSDLRAYYEEELRELRKALSDSIELTVPSADTSMQSTIQNQLLEAENRHLLDKVKAMEDELEELYARIRTSEQKNIGLEKRASEYAAAFGDSQAMGVQHRAHIEELQRYCRERDDLVNDLESKVRSQEDGVKLYKKSFDEEMELHRQDKIALQRITDKYESMDREFKLLQETMTVTENKLYEARTEIVELNRAMSKMELENKRLGRENDNLRHKVTQSLNLSTMHESFGSPSSPRGEIVSRISQVRPKSPVQSQTFNESRVKSCDERIPGFAGATGSLNSMEKNKSTSNSKIDRSRLSESSRKSDANISDKKEKRERITQMARKDVSETSGRKQAGFARSSNNEVHRDNNWQERSRPPNTEEQVPVRDRTPPRSSSVASQAESEISDYSPLLKAERELFKLRDMMRHAVAIKPSNSPPAPKLQKKFYGSERPTNKDDFTPDLGGPGRGQKEKPNNHGSVAKTKSVPVHSKSDRTAEKSGKRGSSSRSDRGSTKSKERSSEREKDRKEKLTNQTEEDAPNCRTPPRRRPTSGVNPELYDSPTRFDINVNEDRRSENQNDGRRSGHPKEDRRLGSHNEDHWSRIQNDDRRSASGTQKRGDNQSIKQRNLFESDGDVHPVREEPTGAPVRNERNLQESGDKVTSTLDMMKNGQYTTRPQWEDVFTSMVKPKPETQAKVKTMTTEEKVNERLRSISEMESRYDGLQVEKRQLESSINKIPLHGRVDRNSRREKEKLEDRLESVDREIGSLKMTLKRYNVLKTAG